MEQQKHEIGLLKAKVSNVSVSASRRENMLRKVLEKECAALKRDVVVLRESCIGLKNVIAAGCGVVAVCVGVIFTVWTA